MRAEANIRRVGPLAVPHPLPQVPGQTQLCSCSAYGALNPQPWCNVDRLASNYRHQRFGRHEATAVDVQSRGQFSRLLRVPGRLIYNERCPLRAHSQPRSAHVFCPRPPYVLNSHLIDRENSPSAPRRALCIVPPISTNLVHPVMRPRATVEHQILLIQTNTAPP